MRQCIVARGENCADQDAFERKLIVIRKQTLNPLARLAEKHDLPELVQTYIPSMSSRTIVYKGLLLASAVAYNALLSAIPIAAVLAVILSQFMDDRSAYDVISRELGWVAPTQAAAIATDLATFVEHRDLVGGIGVFVLLFFSALAFRMLDQAFEAIFGAHAPRDRRGYWIRVALPYAFVVVLCVFVIVLTLVSSWIESFAGRTVLLLGRELAFPQVHGLMWVALGLVVQGAVFTVIYIIMPSSHIPWRRAVIGGASAAVMWEITRRVMVWYFTNVSLVSVIYGSLETVVVILLMMEAGAIIVLLGAQVIAELSPLEQRIPAKSEPVQPTHGQTTQGASGTRHIGVVAPAAEAMPPRLVERG